MAGFTYFKIAPSDAKTFLNDNPRLATAYQQGDRPQFKNRKIETDFYSIVKDVTVYDETGETTFQEIVRKSGVHYLSIFKDGKTLGEVELKEGLGSLGFAARLDNNSTTDYVFPTLDGGFLVFYNHEETIGPDLWSRLANW